MNTTKHRPRLAVVSPFLDKRNGTERIVVEWVSRLVTEFEIHIYSQRVADLDLSRVTWHRIPALRGPHLFGFLWWFAANQIWRTWHRYVHGLRYDVIFSPGCNCLDADAVSVHVVFAEYLRKIKPQLRLMRQSVKNWPRLIHRKLYYRLIIFLERRTYTRPDVQLVFIARRTVPEVERFYGPHEECPVLYPGLDHKTFNPHRRLAVRREAREKLEISNGCFALLLIGNDWRNKGVPVLVDALAQLRELPVDLFVVSREEPTAARVMIQGKSLGDRVHFLPPREDVEFYYAAADVYAGPSLEDTFALPPAEAMASGLPVIVSSENGVSEVITHGVDGLILADPKDAVSLAAMIRRLYEDEQFRSQLGEKAAATARQYTWESNSRELAEIFQGIARRNARPASQTLTQET